MMKDLKISQNERRMIIVLMLINVFALLVNYFGLSPNFEIGTEYRAINQIYLFTDSNEYYVLDTRNSKNIENGNSNIYTNRHTNHFWPFTTFYEKPYGPIIQRKYNSRFRGIFADFDHTEFLIYTILIFGAVLIKKLW